MRENSVNKILPPLVPPISECLITPDGFDDTSPQGDGSENMNAKTVNATTKTTNEKPEAKRLSPKEWKKAMEEKSTQLIWDRVVAPMLEGDLPSWSKPWKAQYTVFGSTQTRKVDLDPNRPFCVDHDSAAHCVGYRGFNRSMLGLFAGESAIPAFGTAKQWVKVAKRIAKMKGESTKDMPLVIPDENQSMCIPLMRPQENKNVFLGRYEIMGKDGKPIMVKCKKTGEMKPKTKARFGINWGVWNFFVVFPFEATNLDLNDVMNCIKWEKKEQEEFVPETILRMDELIKRCSDLDSLEGAQELAQKMLAHVALAGGLKHGGDRAYYTPMADAIQMPKAEDFKGSDNAQKLARYAHTLCHEFSHATGHHSRLRRDLLNGKSSEKYAREELVAEISAVICCASLGIETEGPQHATYLKGWANRVVGPSLRAENENAWKEACWKVMRDAQSAAEWVAYGTIPEGIQRRLNAEAAAKAKGEEVAVPDAAGNAPEVSYDNPLEVVA